MSSYLLRPTLLGAMLLLNLQYATCVGMSGQRDAAVTEVRGRMAVVHLTDSFVRAARDGGVAGVSDELEVRRLTDSPTGELLLAAKTFSDDKGGEGHYVYSDNIYAVSLDGKFNVRRVSRQEWDRAQPVKDAGERMDAPKEDDPKRPGMTRLNDKQPFVSYKGKQFAKTGESWSGPGALVSQDGRWVAVFSHTSEKVKVDAGVPGLGGRGTGVGPGEMFVDVYDTSSGEKVIAGRAPHEGGLQPGTSFDESLWADGRYLVVPLDLRTGPGDSYFIGVLPN
jgi:hypothetical protein